MTIQENVNLSGLNTFKTGGGARFFCIVKGIDDLEIARLYAKESGLKIFFLGAGSNVLIADTGFDGLVIKSEIDGREILQDGCARFGSGVRWDDVVAFCIDSKLYGMENMSHIPGTVGASVVGNMGAYGAEAKDFVKIVEVYDFDTGQTFFLTKDQCEFNYRNSVFKQKPKWFIVSVEYILNKNFVLNSNYPDIKNRISDMRTTTPTAHDIRKAVIQIRDEKLPDLKILGTAGSFFKNIVIEEAKAQELKNKFPELPIYDADNGQKKISLGFVLDKICGLKGKRVGNVGLFEKQALVVVNYGNATTKEIISFIDFIKDEVKNKTGIEIESEVVMI